MIRTDSRASRVRTSCYRLLGLWAPVRQGIIVGRTKRYKHARHVNGNPYSAPSTARALKDAGCRMILITAANSVKIGLRGASHLKTRRIGLQDKAPYLSSDRKWIHPQH